MIKSPIKCGQVISHVTDLKPILSLSAVDRRWRVAAIHEGVDWKYCGDLADDDIRREMRRMIHETGQLTSVQETMQGGWRLLWIRRRH